MKVGDRVVCVKAHSQPECPLKVGKVYIILDMLLCSCGEMCIHVGIGNPGDWDATSCGCGRLLNPDSIWWLDPDLFRPIEYNSATEELANKKVVEEKSDIPIKEPQKEKV